VHVCVSSILISRWALAHGSHFHRLLHENKHDPAKFNGILARLFTAMSTGGTSAYEPFCRAP